MKKIVFMIGMGAILFACVKETPVVEPDELPTAANLIFPYENSLCNVGTNVTVSESDVIFEWAAGEYTDTYELVIKNLFTGTEESFETPGSEISVTLLRSTPYEWHIVSKSNAVADVANSVSWRFYNAGEGIESYIPFPAEIVTPLMADTIVAASGVVTIDWIGSDVDNDIEGYDIFFGTASPPPVYVSNHQESILNDVPVTVATVYFWKVITIDSRGNKSDSGIYQFRVES